MKQITRSVPKHIRYLVLVFLLQVVLYTIFRLILFYQYNEQALSFKNYFSTSLYLGFQMDLQVSAYILLLPFLFLSLQFLFFEKNNWLGKLANWFAMLGIIASFIICICNLPYYHFYKNTISADILIWMSNVKQSLLYLKNEPSYLPYIIVLCISVVVLYFVIRFIYKRNLVDAQQVTIKQKIGWFIVSTLLMIHCMRGAVMTRPIGIRDAFITNNAFVNNLALNPSLCFFFTLDFFKVRYTSNEDARNYVSQSIHEQFMERGNTWVRKIETDSTSSPRKNVVVIIMESLSANRMQFFGDSLPMTPFLDSLVYSSLFFKNIYSCGSHTHNGIFGTLYGMPSLPSVHPFSNAKTSTLEYEGLATSLKKQHYSTSFYCTHNEEFDNLGFFLRKNGFESIYSEKDYPTKWHEHYLGISDEHLYSFVLNKLDEKASTKKPFFDCIMTVTSHLPGMLPTQTVYQGPFKNDDWNTMHYADWALHHFLDSCKMKPWFKNTVFVIVGDHGVHIADDFAAPLSLNHVPLFFYNTNVPSSINENYGTQADIYASLMYLLGLPYNNYSVSNNLFTSKNSMAYFIQDNQICCLDSTHYLVMNKYGKDFLYDFKHQNKNVIDDDANSLEKLKKHVYSFLQLAQIKMDEAK